MQPYVSNCENRLHYKDGFGFENRKFKRHLHIIRHWHCNIVITHYVICYSYMFHL